MGLKENFAQAVKELTGADKGAKTPPKPQNADALKRVFDVDPVLEQTGDTVFMPSESNEQSQARMDKQVSAKLEQLAVPASGLPFATNSAPTENIPPLLQGQTQNSLNIGKNELQALPPQPNSDTASPAEPVENSNNNNNQNPPPPGVNIPGVTPLTQPLTAPKFPGTGGGNNSHIFGGGNAGGNNSGGNLYNASSGEELTIISKNTVIDGNIRSFANMGIEGDIKGDVETTKNVELSGRIVGNLTCNNAQLHVSQVQGNIRMKGNVEMERDTLLIGDLMSTFAKINGKIKGNLDVGGKMELKSDAVIFGDISASTITVDDGAIIQGYVSTTFLSKEESRNIFPEAVTIDN